MDWQAQLEDSESIIISAIQNYFALMWSRHWKKFDDNRYASRVLSLIAVEIRDGMIPHRLIFTNFVPAELYCSNRPIPRQLIEAYFCRVADYLFEKRMKPDKIRQKEYEDEIIGKK